MSDGSDGGYIYSNFVTNSGSRTVQSPTNDLADNEGEWINATVTYSSSGDLKLFVNGVLKDELKNSSSLVVAHYSGLSVSETDELRKEMRKGLEKEYILKEEDRVLIYKFINKLSAEINSVENN